MNALHHRPGENAQQLSIDNQDYHNWRINLINVKLTNLVEILATCFTITAEVNVRKETPIKMSVCFPSVLFY